MNILPVTRTEGVGHNFYLIILKHKHNYHVNIIFKKLIKTVSGHTALHSCISIRAGLVANDAVNYSSLIKL